MFPVIEGIINTENKRDILKIKLPNIEAETAFVNYKIHSSIIGMYNNMANSVFLLEKCKADENCTNEERKDAQEKIEQNEINTNKKYNIAKDRYGKMSEKIAIIESSTEQSKGGK